MDKREFIRIGAAGVAGGLFVPRDLMAGMVEPALKTKLEGGVYHTDEAFGRWNKGVAEHHLPALEKSGGSLHVATHHPMGSYGHYIIKHEVMDAQFKFMNEHLYNPTTDAKPETTFDLGGHSGLVYVLTMCNVHDVWLNAIEV